MPVIKSISDLRNHANEISELCHKYAEPIFITKNGQGDLVVMSQTLFERHIALFDLYSKLDEAEKDVQTGDMGISHTKMIEILRNKL